MPIESNYIPYDILKNVEQPILNTKQFNHFSNKIKWCIKHRRDKLPYKVITVFVILPIFEQNKKTMKFVT